MMHGRRGGWRRLFRWSAGALIAAALLVFPVLCHAGDEWEPFLGTWEYRQASPAAESGYDPEGERLRISRTGQAVKAVYFGVEREGEHGLFYSVTEVDDLSLDRQGRISFTVPARRLYHQRPESLEAAQKRCDEDGGFTSDGLHLTGTMENGRLVLQCASQFGNCPDQHMVFKKTPWKEGR